MSWCEHDRASIRPFDGQRCTAASVNQQSCPRKLANTPHNGVVDIPRPGTNVKMAQVAMPNTMLASALACWHVSVKPKCQRHKEPTSVIWYASETIS